MKFASLTLVLIASKCLTADNNSSRRDFSPTNSLDPQQLAELERKYISIEKASQMSLVELVKLENDSAEYLKKGVFHTHFCEEYLHKANSALARLFKQSKEAAVQLSTFDSWKESRFSASNFFDVVAECVQRHSVSNWRIFVRFLGIGAIQWHQNTGLFFKGVKGEDYTFNYHNQHLIAIDFIYRSKLKLNSSDIAELERYIRDKSPYSVRKLARRIVASDKYSKEDLIQIQSCSSFYNDTSNYGDRITFMAYLFCEELRLAWKESELLDHQSQDPVVSFDVESALYSKDANGIAKAFEHCMSRAADVGANTKCLEALEFMWKISLHRSELEQLTNRFDVSSCYHHNSQHRNVVEPAYILLKARFFKNQ